MTSRNEWVAHWQVLVREPERAATFYARCFGWSSDDRNALGYRALANAGVAGGIWPLPEGQPKVQLFVAVPDIDEALERVTENGGRVILPKQVLPDGDEMALFEDTEGISWGLMRARGPA